MSILPCGCDGGLQRSDALKKGDHLPDVFIRKLSAPGGHGGIPNPVLDDPEEFRFGVLRWMACKLGSRGVERSAIYAGPRIRLAVTFRTHLRIDFHSDNQ